MTTKKTTQTKTAQGGASDTAKAEEAKASAAGAADAAQGDAAGAAKAKPEAEAKPKPDAKKADEPKVQIRATRDPYRRAGLALGREPRVFSAASITRAQAEALEADPNVFIEPARED